MIFDLLQFIAIMLLNTIAILIAIVLSLIAIVLPLFAIAIGSVKIQVIFDLTEYLKMRQKARRDDPD